MAADAILKYVNKEKFDNGAIGLIFAWSEFVLSPNRKTFSLLISKECTSVKYHSNIDSI